MWALNRRIHNGRCRRSNSMLHKSKSIRNMLTGKWTEEWVHWFAVASYLSSYTQEAVLLKEGFHLKVNVPLCCLSANIFERWGGQVPFFWQFGQSPPPPACNLLGPNTCRRRQWDQSGKDEWFCTCTVGSWLWNSRKSHSASTAKMDAPGIWTPAKNWRV